jgi:titin
VIDDAHFVKIDTVDQNIVTFTDNVSADTKYYYKVTAYNETGNSEYTNIVGITSLSVPAKPLELVAKIITQGSVTLTWHDMSTNESGFKLERSLARSSGFALLQTLAADKTTASDNTIIAKTKYYYRIKSVNAVGESAYSNLDSAFWIPTPSPATELAVKQDKLNELTLTWKDASSDEGGFTIERSTNGTDYTKAGAVAANIVTFKDAVEPNKQYSYRIVAFNDGGNSAPSNTVAFTSLFVPSAPTSATARFIDATKKLVVAWEDHSTNEDGFAIERAPNATSTFTEIARVSANATEFVDTNISSIGSEVYKVRAYNKVSFSEYSNSVSVQLISAIEPVEAIRIEVYPNPTDDLLIVRFDKVVSQGSTWVAIDAIGRAWKLTPTIKENAYQFSVGHLEKGLYILRSINQRNGARSVRFEKQ